MVGTDGPITVHTTAPLRRLEALLWYGEHRDAGQVGTLGHDCIYGWGESRFTKAERKEYRVKGKCRPHNLIVGMEYADAADVARVLIADGYEVVLTDMHDWSELVGNAPIFYLSTHAH
jgi:hypothetical protein